MRISIKDVLEGPEEEEEEEVSIDVRSTEIPPSLTRRSLVRPLAFS